MADAGKAPEADKALADAAKEIADLKAYAAELEKDGKDSAAKSAKEIADLKAKLDAVAKGKGLASADAARAPKLVRMVVTTGATVSDGQIRTRGYEFDVTEAEVADLLPQGFEVLKR